MGGNGASEGRGRTASVANAEVAVFVTESPQHADGHAIMATKPNSANAGTVNAVPSPHFGRGGLFMIQLTRALSSKNIARF